DGGLPPLGGGFPVADYPLTQEVLATGRPRILTIEDPDVDEQEAAVLRQLGFGSLMMLPLELNGGPWGLVEVYRTDTVPFTEDDIRAAGGAVARAAALPGSPAGTTTSAQQPATSAHSGSSTPRSWGWEASISIAAQSSRPSDAAPSSEPIE